VALMGNDGAPLAPPADSRQPVEMDDDRPRGRPPWQLAELEDRFEIRDADNRPLMSIRFYRKARPEPNTLDLMSWDEALKVAQAAMKLPELLRREKRDA
jgi:hypothetical protein